MSSYGNSSIPSLQSTHQQMQQSGPARSGTNNQPNPLSYHQQYASYGSNLSQPQPYGLDPNQSHLSPYGLPGQGQPSALNKNASYGNYPGIPNSPRRPTPAATSYQSSRPLMSGYGSSSNPIHGLGPPPGSNLYSSSPYSNPYGHAGPGGPTMPPSTSELWAGQIHQTRLPYPGYGTAPNSSSTNLAGLHSNVNPTRDGIASSSSYLHGQSSTYSNSSSQLGTNSNVNPIHGQRSYYNQTGMPAPSGLPNPNGLTINSVTSSHPGIQNEGSINSSPFGQPYGPRYPQYGNYSQQTPYDHQQGRVGSYGLSTPQNQSNSSPNYRPSYSNTSTNQIPALSPRRPTPTPPASSPMPPPTSHTPDRGPSVNTITNTTINSSSNNQLTSPGQTQSSINSSLNQTVPPPPSSNSLAQLEQMVMPHLNNNSNNKQNSSYFNIPGLNSSLNNSNNNLSIPQQPTANSQAGLNIIQNNNYPHYSPPVSISQIPGYYPQYGQNSAINTSNNSMWPPTCQIQNLNSTSTTVSKSNTHSPLQNSSNVTYSPASMANKPQTGNSALINKPAASSYNLFDNQYQSPGLTDNSYLKNSTNDNTVIYSQQSNPSANLSQTSQIAEGSNDNKISSINNTGNSTSITNNSETESQNTNESSNYYEMMQQPLNVTDNVRDKADLQRSSSNNQSQRTQNYINQEQSYLNQSDPSYLNQQQPQTSLYHQNQNQQPSQQSSYSSQTNLNSSYSGFQNDSFEMGLGNNQVNSMSGPFNNSNNIPPQHDSMSIYEQNFNSNTGHSNQEYGQLSSNNEMSQAQQPYDPYDDNFANEPALHSSKKKSKGRPKKDMIEQKKEKKPRQPRTSKANKNKLKISPGTPTPGNHSEFENPSCYPLPQQPDLYNQMPNNPMQTQMMPSHMNIPMGHAASIDSSSQVPSSQHSIQPIISQQIPSAQNEIYPPSNINQMQPSSIPPNLELQSSQQPASLYDNQVGQANQLHLNQQPQENINNTMIQPQINTNLQPPLQPSFIQTPGQNPTSVSSLNEKQTALNTTILDKNLNESVNVTSQNESSVKNDAKIDQSTLISEKNNFIDNKKETNPESEIPAFNKDPIFHKDLEKKETSSLNLVPDNKVYDSIKTIDRTSQIDFPGLSQNLMPTTIENIPASSIPNINQPSFNQQATNIPLIPPPPSQVIPTIGYHSSLPVQISQVPVSIYNNPNYLPNQHIRPPYINPNQIIENTSTNQITIINPSIQHIDLNCQVPIQDIQMVSQPLENLQFTNENITDPDALKTKKPKKKKKKNDDKKIDDTSLNNELEINQSLDDKSIEDQSSKKAKKPKRPKKPKKENLLKPNNIDINDQNATLDATIIQDDTMTTDISLDVTNDLNLDSNEATQEGDDSSEKGSKKGLKKTSCSSKSKKPKLKEGGGKSKKKLPKLALKFSNKKKRKRLGSSDGSDVEKTPPSSPKDDDNANKRRSSRVTKKLKYHEDIDLGISDDDDKKEESQAEVTVTNIVEDTMVVEKIMSSRMGTRELELEEEENKNYNQEKPPTLEVEEFYVKYKNLSYLHCEWRTEEELERNDKRVSQKLKRYKQKRDSMISFDFQDDEPFNPDFCEVDRVLDFTEFEEKIPDDEIETKIEKNSLLENEKTSVDNSEKDNSLEKIEVNLNNDKAEEHTSEKIEVDDKNVIDKQIVSASLVEKESLKEEPVKEENLILSSIKEEKLISSLNSNDVKPEEIKQETDKEVTEQKPKTRKVRHFLVKWKGLAYDESTWELEEDLDPIKVANFWRFRNVPPKDKWKLKKKPKASDWKKKEETPNYKNGNKLREYQLEGVNWLMFCWYNNRNCILADEMGLGKTIQSITYIQEINNHGVWGPFLVIVPLSTIGNWQREFETWTDLNVITYHGSSASRNTIQQYEMYYKDEKGEKIEGVYKFQVMITTFEVILTDCIELSGIPWKTCVIDEAHRLKNRNCKLLEGLRLLSFDHRVLLTGTPLQNNVEELFSLLNFLEPIQFGSSELFVQEFGDLKTEDQVTKLKALLKPMMLRRLKEDVEKSLAPKEETIIEVELTNIQKKYYRAILEKNFSFLNKGTTNSNIGNLMNTMMELRKCCIHPFLINGAEEQITYEFKQTKGPSVTQFQTMVQSSGKLVLIDKLLPRLKADGHRVLIFSQMVRCLDILEDYLIQKRYPFERIDGRVRGSIRQAAIDRYSKPGSDRFVFLLCTRAGGLGINLTAADTVIIFDSDWNPQNDLQAQARCHRIGQKKMVKIYRLICRNTYEREMFDKASLKLGLDKAVLQSMNTDKTAKGGLSDGQLSKKEIEDLLKKGAYGALMDDDNAGDKFCEEDIEQILQRRTQVVTIESEEKGSTFSKASFAASDNRSDIELDDPNFWEKWAKKANIDVEEVNNKNELIVEEPRRRVQTRRFGQDDGLLDISDGDSNTDEDDDNVSNRTRGGRGQKIKGRDKKGKRGRGGYERDDEICGEFGPGNWTRSECYKIEKGLLTFGWGRWEEILVSGGFRRKLEINDIEDVARVIALYCCQNYKGDEKIKSFAIDLITPILNEDKKNEDLMNSLTKRQRAGRKKRDDSEKFEFEKLDWAKDERYNPDLLLNDDQYRKHLMRHANKIILRIKLLFYIKHEIIGNLAEQIQNGAHVKDLHMPPLMPDGEPLNDWWDEEADKSLVVGIYKHGFDHYSSMRLDSALCFLSRCGPPDGAALLAELNAEEDIGKTLDEDEDAEITSNSLTNKTETISSLEQDDKKEVSDYNGANFLPFPSTSDLNQRLRKIVTAYQRNFKKQEIRLAQQARNQQRLEKLEKFEAATRERENKKREQAQKKWSRREENEFCKVVSMFGVEYNPKKDKYNWNNFRAFSKFDKKMDETLTEYYKAFYAMCKRVTGKKLSDEEENLPISVDAITEDKATRCLLRIDLLSKIREEILTNRKLDEKLKLCQFSIELPSWWIPGKHDKDLLIGVAKYGLARLDYNLMNDPKLSFKDILKQEELKNLKKEDFENMLKEEDGKIISDSYEKENSRTIKYDKYVENTINELCDNENDLASWKEIVFDARDILENILDCVSMNPPGFIERKSSKDLILMKNEDQKNEDGSLLNQNRSLVKWPKDRVLLARLENVCHCIEKNEWPVKSFFNNSQLSLNSTLNIDSSPKPPSPASLSSMSREPTPHPTPDHTPRRECNSPSDFTFTDDRGRKRRRRGIVSQSFEQQKQNQLQQHKQQIQQQIQQQHQRKLQESLKQQQQLIQQQQQLQQLQQFSKKSGNNLLNNQLLKTFFPSLLNSPFNGNDNKANNFLNDEKAAALFLQNAFKAKSGGLNFPPNALLSAIQAASNNQNNLNNNSKQTSKSSVPPPAHQSLGGNKRSSLESMDLTFTKTNINKQQINSQLNKLSKQGLSLSNKKDRTTPILDLSSGPTFKKDEKDDESSKKNSKKIGSRIDALALNLQAKKMQQDPKTDNVFDYSDSANLSDLQSKSAAQKLENLKKDLLLQTLNSSSQKKSSANVNSFNNKLLETLQLISKLNNNNKNRNQKEIVDKNALLKQNFKKILDEHPDLLNAMPGLQSSQSSFLGNAAATSSKAATSTSSFIPANTELIELPDSRRKVRSSTQQNSVSSSNLKEENLSSLSALNAASKKASASAKNNFNNKSSSSLSNLNSNLLLDLGQALSANPSTNIRTSNKNSDQKNKLNLESALSQLNSQLSGNKSRTTAASLLAAAQNPSSNNTNNSNNNPFANLPGFNPLAGLNPNLMNLPGLNKILMEHAALAAGLKNNIPSTNNTNSTNNLASNSNNTGSNKSTTNNSNSVSNANPFLPFSNIPGFNNLNNSLLGLSGFNLPGLNNSLMNNNLLQNETKNKNNLSSLKDNESNSSKLSSKQSNEKNSSNSNNQQSNNNSSSKNKELLNNNVSNANLINNLPFLPGFSNTNLLNNLPFNPLSLSGLSGLQNSPFANLAQNNLLNGIANFTGGLNNLQANKPKSSNTNSSSTKPNSMPNNPLSKAALAALAAGGNNQFSIANMASLLQQAAGNQNLSNKNNNSKASSSNNQSNQSAKKPAESDDESLKSLMGHEEYDDDLNGDLDDNEDSGSDYEASLKKRGKNTRTQAKRKCTETSKSKK